MSTERYFKPSEKRTLLYSNFRNIPLSICISQKIVTLTFGERERGTWGHEVIQSSKQGPNHKYSIASVSLLQAGVRYDAWEMIVSGR